MFYYIEIYKFAHLLLSNIQEHCVSLWLLETQKPAEFLENPADVPTPLMDVRYQVDWVAKLFATLRTNNNRTRLNVF